MCVTDEGLASADRRQEGFAFQVGEHQEMILVSADFVAAKSHHPTAVQNFGTQAGHQGTFSNVLRISVALTKERGVAAIGFAGACLVVRAKFRTESERECRRVDMRHIHFKPR